MSERDFDAFALPSGVAPPVTDGGASRPESGRARLEGGPMAGGVADLRVRYVGASPAWIDRVTDALRSSGEPLLGRSAADIAHVLGGVGARFLDPKDPLRSEALALLPPTSGLSLEMAARVLDGMASDWTKERLLALLRMELGDENALDGFVRSEGGRACMAVGPSLCVQIVAGSVPGVGVAALIRSLLLKGPTLLKPGRGDVVLPVLFARGLREVEPAVADALAVAYWPGGEADLDAAAMARSDVVTVYGSDETVESLRSLCPVTTRFVAYHHRISVGIVGRDALTDAVIDATAAGVAESVALFDQRGCVSPQVVFVEEGVVPAERFARALAQELARLEDRLPSGPLDAGEASGLQQLRGRVELMAAGGRGSVIHGGGAPWTVILEAAQGSDAGSAGRTVRLRSVTDASQVPELLLPFGPHLQTVGAAGLGGRLESFARACGRVGASRVVPFSSVPFPPPWWHHDGRGPLADLVRWVDLEV